MSKKMLKGKVVSDTNNKTIIVLVKRRYSHPFFKKRFSKNINKIKYGR